MREGEIIDIKNIWTNECGFINVKGSPLKFGEVREKVVKDTEIANLIRAKYLQEIPRQQEKKNVPSK